jgi:hypothetical protein
MKQQQRDDLAHIPNLGGDQAMRQEEEAESNDVEGRGKRDRGQSAIDVWRIALCSYVEHGSC